MRDELQSVLTVVRALPSAELPAFIGQLAELQAVALARLTAPVGGDSLPDRDLEDVLDVAAAAVLIGMSQKWIYRHYDILPHIRIGFGCKPRLRFRRRDLESWLDGHRVKYGKH